MLTKTKASELDKIMSQSELCSKVQQQAETEVMPSSSLVEVEVEVEVEVGAEVGVGVEIEVEVMLGLRLRFQVIFKLFLRVGGWWVGVENEINANSAFN